MTSFVKWAKFPQSPSYAHDPLAFEAEHQERTQRIFSFAISAEIEEQLSETVPNERKQCFVFTLRYQPPDLPNKVLNVLIIS